MAIGTSKSCLLLIACFATPISLAQSPSEQSAQNSISNFNDLSERFCLSFEMKGPEFIGSIIEEMETTPFSVEQYLRGARCQPQGYSNALKAPLLHLIADDPTAKDGMLERLVLYYKKKRKEPELIATWINAKNTKGETLVDYFELLRIRRINTLPEQLPTIEKMIRRACEYGGTYAVYTAKKCP